MFWIKNNKISYTPVNIKVGFKGYTFHDMFSCQMQNQGKLNPIWTYRKYQTKPFILGTKLTPLNVKRAITPISHQKNMSVQYIPSYTPLLHRKTGVCRGIPIFLIFALKHRLWVLVAEAVLACTRNLCFEQK